MNFLSKKSLSVEIFTSQKHSFYNYYASHSFYFVLSGSLWKSSKACEFFNFLNKM